MKQTINFLWALHHKVEPAGFRFVREKGQSSILLLHFLTPSMVVIDGNELNLTRNACIIYTPGIRHDYGATSPTASYENNFLTFSADSSKFFSHYNVPTNEPFYINNPVAITQKIATITWAAASREESLDSELSAHICDLFTLLEAGVTGADPKSRREAQTRQRFIAVRGEIRVNPKVWTVQKMAEFCWLTRSRFYVLYKAYFGVSPSDDLSDATLDFAKERLLSTNSSITSISQECGYKHAESFIRIFSEKVGISPTQFRKSVDIKNGGTL